MPKWVLLALATFLVSGCGGTSNPSGTTQDRAFYAAPNGSGSACTKAAPCSINGAIAAAPVKNGKSDPLIWLRGGNYGSYTTSGGPGTGDCYEHVNDFQTTNCRSFVVYPGETATFSSLTAKSVGTLFAAYPPNGSHLNIGGYYWPNPNNVISGATIDPGDGDPGVYIDSTSKIGVISSEITGVRDNDGIDVYGGHAGVSDVLIQGNNIHGVRLSNGSSQHTDGIQLAQTAEGQVYNVTIRGNRLWDNDQNSDLQIDTSGPIIHNTLVENNFMGVVNDRGSVSRSITLGGVNTVVRNNSLLMGVIPYPVFSGRVSNNIMPPTLANGCQGSGTWDHNVYFANGPLYGGAYCGSNQKVLSNLAAIGFVDPANLDLHLTASSPAIGWTNTDFPSVDIDGQARPQGGFADAGADER